jgi:hypothetical protein
MNIVKDDNWYTVYNKDGVYMACYQDKDWAQFAARHYGGRYTITEQFVERPEYKPDVLIDYKHNEFLRLCGLSIMMISLLLMIISLIALPFNLEYWLYHLLAFVFFGVTTCFGMWFSHRYTQYYE